MHLDELEFPSLPSVLLEASTGTPDTRPKRVQPGSPARAAPAKPFSEAHLPAERIALPTFCEQLRKLTVLGKSRAKKGGRVGKAASEASSPAREEGQKEGGTEQDRPSTPREGRRKQVGTVKIPTAEKTSPPEETSPMADCQRDESRLPPDIVRELMIVALSVVLSSRGVDPAQFSYTIRNMVQTIIYAIPKGILQEGLLTSR